MVFVCCFDLSLRLLGRLLEDRPGGAFGVADDIALVMAKVSVQLPQVMVLLVEWRQTTVMKTNVKKCVLIPVGGLF